MLTTMCHAQIADRLFYAPVSIEKKGIFNITVVTEEGEHIAFTRRPTGFFVEADKGEQYGRRLLCR